MSIDKVRAYFAQYGMEGRIIEFDVSSATVELAAQALGVSGARICKTLSFRVHDACVLILAAGDARIDNARYKHRFGTKARMLSREEVAEQIGHDVGGVCPFAVPASVEVYADVSLKRFFTVFPAAGSAASAIEMRPDELFRYANARDWVDVCRDWTEPGDPAFTEAFLPLPALADGEIYLRLDTRYPGDGKRGYVPAYKFAIVRQSDGAQAGTCDLRLGYTRGLYFGGHIGYAVDEAYRGSGYAGRAARLLLEVARLHEMPYVRITCRPDNLPSRRTIERLGGVLEGVVPLPPDTEMYRAGSREECLFRFDL